MDRNQGQDGQYAGWNHASAGGTPAPRQPVNGAFKPLSPVRPLTAYRPNEPYRPDEPYPARDRQDAPGPYNRPTAYPPQNGEYPPPNGGYSAQPGAWQGQPPPNDTYSAQQGAWQGQPPQNSPYPPQGTPPAQYNARQGQPSQSSEPSPQHAAPAQPAWLPGHISPEEMEQPVRRTYLQPVPQTAPPEWRTAPPAPQPVEAVAEPAPPPPAAESATRPVLPTPAVQPTPVAESALWEPHDDGPDDDADMPDGATPPHPAEPMTVPTFGYQPPRRGGGRRVMRPLLLTLAALAAVLAALYFTGVLGTLLGTLMPKPQSDVPAVFEGQAAAAAAGVAPAAKAPVPALSSFTVSPQSAEAPATLTFSLVTNAAADSIRLMNGENALLPAEVGKAPQGDGYLWTAQAAFGAPYTGQVRAYLRGMDGQWHACEPAVSVEVR